MNNLKFFRVDKHDHIAEVVMNRPQKFNMIGLSWADELASIMTELEKSDDVRVVLIWSEGKMFTAGLDLKEFAAIGSGGVDGSKAVKSLHFYSTLKRFQLPFKLIEKCKKPVVAAVHGKCIGGGVDLITACDIRLATEDATFSVKETQIGMVADLGTIPRITRIVGRGVYNEMVFTGEEFPAKRALNFGFVNQLFEDKNKLLEGARELCSKIAKNSPLAVQGAKRVLQFAEEHTTSDTLDHIGLWNSAFLESEDLMEAVAAFMQKRSPIFINKL
eukprot:TRINITY_DN5293_c0_g1_i1.p1 TRINITY_DN5293_c0_g1~~TRINITY_DN5293_c0_g1_i1.p1  ORF type:complete len:274 (+),score=45.02 TRINITY_DN5293_c0_g1_i1:28-849(+)